MDSLPKIPDELLTDGPINTPWAPKNLSGKHLVMCEYHLSGMTNREIASLLGYHEIQVGNVLRSEEARAYISSRIEDLNQRLHAQFELVVNNMDEGLRHSNIDIRKQFTDMWFKAHGRYTPKATRTNDAPVSAEDVVQRLLEKAKTVNINIDNRSVNTIPKGVDDYSFLEKE